MSFNSEMLQRRECLFFYYLEEWVEGWKQKKMRKQGCKPEPRNWWTEKQTGKKDYYRIFVSTILFFQIGDRGTPIFLKNNGMF